MKRSSALPDDSGTFLRIVLPEEVNHEPDEADVSAVGHVSENSRLRQFFNRWYRPIAIDGPGLAEGTLLGYQELLGWWERLTPDPPLRLIDNFQTAEFAKRLRKATYKRGPLSQPRPLSPSRVSLLLRNLRSILNRIGAEREPDKPTAGLALKVPAVPVEVPELDPKAAFTLEQARAIVAAGRLFDRPKIEGVPAWQFWRGVLAWYYVTGVRRGTLFGFEWSMLAARRDHWLLTLPGRLVDKTGKGKLLAVPRWAYLAIGHWPRTRPEIFTFPHDIDHLNDLHYELQALAGIPDPEQLSIQAWRRTHANAMGDCGLSLAEKLAQSAMDHGDSRTTKASYANFENRVRLKLPPLWDDADEPANDRQLVLFPR